MQPNELGKQPPRLTVSIELLEAARAHVERCKERYGESSYQAIAAAHAAATIEASC